MKWWKEQTSIMCCLALLIVCVGVSVFVVSHFPNHIQRESVIQLDWSIQRKFKHTLTLLSVFIGNWFIPHILFKPKKPTISLSVCFFVEIVVSSSEFQLSPQPNTQQNGVSEDKGGQPHRRNGWYVMYLTLLISFICVSDLSTSGL